MLKQPLLDRQHFVRAGAHEHDVEQALLDILANRFAVLLQRAKSTLVGIAWRIGTGRSRTEGHVGIFRIGQDEVV